MRSVWNRMVGAWMAIPRLDLPDDIGTMVRNVCVENGVILRATGDRMLASPPLTITEEDVDLMVSTLRKGLDKIWAEAKDGSLRRTIWKRRRKAPFLVGLTGNGVYWNAVS